MMPGFKTHKKVGMIAALIFSIIFVGFVFKRMPLTGWKLLLIPIVIIVYSQIPDLDSYTSRIKRRFLQLSFLVMLLSVVIYLFTNISTMLIILAIFGVFGLSIFKMPHRGPLHSFWFVLIASIPLLSIHWFLALLAFVCGMSHILADKIYSGTKRKVKKMFGIRSENHYHIKIFGG